MSANWTVYCATCEVFGPDIRRSAGMGYHLSGKWPRYHRDYERDDPSNVDVQAQWSVFMQEHEWHGQLELRHE